MMASPIAFWRLSARLACAGLTLGALASTLPASAQERMPPVPPDTYDAAQKKAAEEFQAARKAPVSGPFSILIRIPELMTANRRLPAAQALHRHDAIRARNSHHGARMDAGL